jgi:hypothetical protein
MADDPDAGVRAAVLHTLCDGSPKHMEESVLAALEKFNRDEDGAVRRKAHKVMASVRRTGRWNIM